MLQQGQGLFAPPSSSSVPPAFQERCRCSGHVRRRTNSLCPLWKPSSAVGARGEYPCYFHMCAQRGWVPAPTLAAIPFLAPGAGGVVTPLPSRAPGKAWRCNQVGAGLRERSAPSLLPSLLPAPSRQEKRPPGAASHQNEAPAPQQSRSQPVGSQGAHPGFSHRVSEHAWNCLARTFLYMEEINPYRAGVFIRVFSQSGFTHHRAAESWEPCAHVTAVIGRSLSPVLVQHLMEQLMGVYLCAPRNCVRWVDESTCFPFGGFSYTNSSCQIKLLSFGKIYLKTSILSGALLVYPAWHNHSVRSCIPMIPYS